MSYGQRIVLTGLVFSILVFTPTLTAIRVSQDIEQEDHNELNEQQQAVSATKWCGLVNRWDKFKEYHFEFKFSGNQSDTAMVLLRDPTHPKLVVFDDAKWYVLKKTEHGNTNLLWKASRVPGKVIDLRSLVSLTRMHVPVQPPNGTDDTEVEEEIGIKLKYANNDMTEFVGGIYMPTRLMKQALDEAPSPVEAETLTADFDDAIGDEVWDAGTGAFKTTLGTTTTGTGISGAFLISAIMGGLTHGTPLGAYVGGAVVGGALGVGVGLGVGVALGVALGGSAAAWQAFKQRKELKLSATEKIWKKMECHAWFTRCSEDVIVPYGKPCPTDSD